MSPQDRNDAITKAISHPIRRKILRYMAQSANGSAHTASPSQLAETLSENLGTVAYHVRLLAEAGIIKLTDTQPRRGAVEHFYTRSGNPLDKKVEAFLNMLKKD